MGRNCYEVLLICLLYTGLTSYVTSLNVTFEKVSTLYLPYTYSPTEMYRLGEDASEQIAYDTLNKLLYSVGKNNIHVIDLSATGYNMTVLYHKTYDNVGISDIEVCGNFLFVAFSNETDVTQGFVNVYEAYNRQNNTLHLIHSIVVGSSPDMIQPLSDCSKVLVAVEAIPYFDEQGTFVDPAGGVGIIKFSTTPAGNYMYNLLGFEAFNSRFSDLEQTGVHFVFAGNNNTFSNDLEPEYIALNPDQTKAFISLQENNAIAVVNIQSENIENIFGLGFKNWSAFTMDPSDKDGGINMNTWPVLGMYQPDAIAAWRHNNVDYIITANEGSAKDYPGFFSEEVRVKDVTLSSTFESNITERSRLLEDQYLGRLKITTGKGWNDSNGEVDDLYSFGGRSFSIRRADTMELVYDSGNDISNRTATTKPYLFNANAGTDNNITSSSDQRSDDKGAEVESIITAQLGNYTLIIVGNERPGTVAVYSIDNLQESIEPKFETLLSDIPEVDESWNKVYDEHRLSMLDPEGLKFLSETDSPHGEPLLIVSGSYSGTITIFKVIVGMDESGDPNSTTAAMVNQGFLLLTAAVHVLKTFL